LGEEHGGTATQRCYGYQLQGAHMCQRTTCRTCGKATYRGCGRHVERVLAGVPRSQRCTCDRTRTRPAGGLLARLRGR